MIDGLDLNTYRNKHTFPKNTKYDFRKSEWQMELRLQRKAESTWVRLSTTWVNQQGTAPGRPERCYQRPQDKSAN